MSEKYHSLSVRFPVGLWDKIKKYQEGRPHFPLNAIMKVHIKFSGNKSDGIAY
jgi:hypothetical protein